MERRKWTQDDMDGNKGVQCPNCHSRLSTVYGVLNRHSQIRRVRICGHCGQKFVTFERVAEDCDRN